MNEKMHDAGIAKLHDGPCSCELETALRGYAARLKEVNGDNLVGAFVFGSIARQCYHPQISDADVLAVTTRPCTEREIAASVSVSQHVGVPIDAVFVSCEQLNSDQFPSPIDFLIKSTGGAKAVRKPEGSKEFLLHKEDVYEVGVPLTGPCPHELLNPVPWSLVEQCLDRLFPHLVPNFKNPELMLCRALYSHAHRRQCSKRSAGEWAARALPKRWRPLIRAALSAYAGGDTSLKTPQE